jgi:hypothetical protein
LAKATLSDLRSVTASGSASSPFVSTSPSSAPSSSEAEPGSMPSGALA